MIYAYLAMVGWCGTRWPGWWWPHPHPGPDPEPWLDIVSGLIGMAGGIIAVGLFRALLPEGLTAVTTTALLGGLFASSAATSLARLRKTTVRV